MCLIIEMCASRFVLGFTYDAIYIFARHMFMHISCICILSFSLFLVVMLFSLSLSLSLSLSWIDCVWHLSAKPLRLGTLLVLGLLLLILPFPLFTFGFVMGRPNRTFLRTFRNVAFIRSVMLFCWTFLTLLSLQSFELEAENLFVRDP